MFAPYIFSFLAVLAAVVYAAISQGNGPAYIPVYSLVGLSLVSWIYNRSNISNLRIVVARRANGFAGNLLLIPFKLYNASRRPKFGLKISTPGEGIATVGQLDSVIEGSISLPAKRRGHFRLDGVLVSTVFPLGVFKAAYRQAVDCEYYVYPEPKGTLPLTALGGNPGRRQLAKRVPGDDFSGVRRYVDGESQRHVDWKAVARGQPLVVKQFESAVSEELWLDWSHLPGMDTEERLSQLALWIVQCERQSMRYGLRLPGQTRAPSLGDSHYHHCLQMLAVFRKPEAESRNPAT
ncbi:MAG TPA: DUF58 domain-containing protein [Chthoniobacterales bacterium]